MNNLISRAQKSLLHAIRSNQLMLGLIMFYTLIYGYHLTGIPGILYDEMHYADTALEFSKHGHFINQNGGFSGQQFFLYPFLLGLFFKLFSPSFVVARSFSWLIGLISALLFYKIIKKTVTQKKWVLIAMLGFIFLNTNIVMFRIIRPEIILSCLFLLLIYYFLFVHDKRKFLHWIGLGGILSLLTLTHLIGFYASIGMLIYTVGHAIQTRSIKPCIGVLIGGLPLGVLFFLNIIDQHGSIISFYVEMSQGSKLSNGTDLNLLWINISEFLFASYAMGYKRLVIVMIECLTIGLGIFSRHRSIKWLSISLCLFLALGFFTINPFLRPYFCILPITTLVILFIKLHENPSIYIKSLIIVYLGYHLLGSGYFFYLQREANPLPIKAIQSQLTQSQFPMIGEAELWFVDPNRKWEMSKTPDHKKLINQYGGYYVLTSEYRSKNKSTTSGSRAIHPHDSFQTRHQVLLNRGEAYGDRLYHQRIHPYGMISLYKVSDKSRGLD